MSTMRNKKRTHLSRSPSAPPAAATPRDNDSERRSRGAAPSATLTLRREPDAEEVEEDAHHGERRDGDDHAEDAPKAPADYHG
jgi:hypothetical protein